MITVISSFDYSAMVPETASGLRLRADNIRSRLVKNTADMIDIGRELIAVQDQLDHGQFTPWVDREISISIRTAQFYMRFAVLKGKYESISLLPPPIVRALGAKSTPATIIEQVVERAKAGDIASDAEVKELIDEDRHQRREAERVRERLKKDRRKSAKVLAAEREAKAERERERERERAAVHGAAQSIIDRLAPDDLRFVVEALARHGFEVTYQLLTMTEGLRNTAHDRLPNRRLSENVKFERDDGEVWR